MGRRERGERGRARSANLAGDGRRSFADPGVGEVGDWAFVSLWFVGGTRGVTVDRSQKGRENWSGRGGRNGALAGCARSRSEILGQARAAPARARGGRGRSVRRTWALDPARGSGPARRVDMIWPGSACGFATPASDHSGKLIDLIKDLHPNSRF
jgi:hypothetical protein